MGQKFAAYDAQGVINGFYDSADSPLPDGVAAIAITADQWFACITTPGYVVRNGVLVAPTPLTDAEKLAALQPALCVEIDAAADAAYVAIGGSSPGRLAEYQQASTDANAYRAAGYDGTIPPTILCQCIASGQTPQQATDDIIAMATAWNQALVAIRSARLIGKSKVNASTTSVDAQAQADAAMANIMAVASATE
jgi:hypothetical protein